MNEQGFKVRFGRRLKLLRELSGLTQSQLAEKIDVTMQYVSMVERGLSSPSFKVLADLCATLGVEPASMFLFSDKNAGAECPGGEPAVDLAGLPCLSAVYDYDAASGKGQWSGSIRDILGQRRDAGKNLGRFLDSVHPDDLQRVRRASEQLHKGLDSGRQLLRIIRQDGEVRTIMAVPQRVYQQDGLLARVLITILDITDQQHMAVELVRNAEALKQAVKARTKDLEVVVEQLRSEMTRRQEMENSLREASDRLAAHLEYTPLCVVELDADMCIEYWSGACERTFGWTAAEALGRTSFELGMVPQESLAILAQRMQTLRLKSPSQWVYDAVNLSKDGRRLNLRWFCSIKRDAQDRLLSIFALGLDQTAQHLAEEAQRRTQEDMRRILASSSEFAGYYDKDFHIVWSQGRGIRPEVDSQAAPGGRHCYEVRRGLSSPCPDCAVLKAIHSGQPAEGLQHKDDGRSILQFAHPVHDENGEVLGAVAIGLDVTASMQAVEAVRAQEALYHAVFEGNAAIKLLTDPQNGQIIDANAAACEYYGWTKAELLTRKIWQINTLPEAEVRQAMARALEKRFTLHFQHRLASGQVRDVEVHSGPVVCNGRVLLLSIIHDISERRRTELLRQEFEQLLHDDIKTPALTIRSGVRLLQCQHMEAEAEEYVAEIDRAALRMLEVLDNSLEVSRLAKGDYALQLAPLDVPDLAVRLFQALPCPDGPAIALHVADAVAQGFFAIADESLVRLVLVNLLRAVCKALPQGGRIYLDCARQDSGWWLDICGGEADRVLESSPDGSPAGGGWASNRLGISLARMAAAIHGGEVLVLDADALRLRAWFPTPDTRRTTAS